jgi:glycosyltransferase involved in cell wall biosynthesis
MNPRRKYDVCASVISDLQFDARVWKEARSLAGAGRSVSLCGPVFDIERAARRRDMSGLDVHEFPFGNRRGGKSYPRRISAVLRVWASVLRTDARVYHAHDIHVAPPAWVASRLRGARLVYDAHELWTEPEAPGPRARIASLGQSLLERLMVTTSDAVFTTNDSRAQTLTQRYGRTDVTVLANVPSLTAELDASAAERTNGKRTVLYMGRIMARSRAFFETIQALRHLDDNVELAVIGFGWESQRDQIREWARDLGVVRRVHLLAPMPFDQLAHAASAAHVGLVPIYGETLSDRLGDTNKLHEYLMGGVPVVASDLPEIRRVVTMGEPQVGELFDPRSPESIARAVAKVIDDPHYEDRRKEARRLAEEYFNWTVEERKLLDVYARMLGDRATPLEPVLEEA